MTSAFLNVDKNDMKRLGVEAGVTGLLGAVAVVTAYFSGHDVGTSGPIIVWVLAMATSFLKKLMTDNTVAK